MFRNITMEPCPTGREVTDFQFKQFSSIRIFPSIDYQQCFSNPSNTITASNKHGLLIVGTPTGFQIINFAQFVSPNANQFVNENTDYPRREYNINAQPSHISLNCDETLLSIAHQHTDNSPFVRIYKMASLTNQSKNKVIKIPMGPPGTCITDFSWNPVIPDLLAVCVSNGCLCLYSHDDTGKKLNMLPPDKQVSCVSWSPKGKQLLAGDKYGNIVQYKPDLKEPQKVVPPPKDLFPNQCSIVNVVWLSVYQYGVIYVNNQSFETHFSIVNAPKGGPVRYVSYDEICFNSGTVRPHQFYLLHVPAWNILIISSANSTEVSVLSLLDDKISWEQWLQEDSTRLDLPIDKNRSETYPVGVTLAYCSQLKIKWGENKFLEPMPTLSIVSNDGLVLLFHVINITPNAGQLCTPATPLPDHMFGTQAQPLNQTSAAAAPTPQVSVVSALPPNFMAAGQGQSPVLEISTNQNAASATPPLSLFNKPQISITPVSQVPKDAQAPPSFFPQQPIAQVQASPQKPDMFQAMANSVFQTVIQGNTNTSKPAEIPQASQPQVKTTPVAPTIVKTSLDKQQLIVEEPREVKQSTPKEKTGTIKKEDLKIFMHLEESINKLLKAYKINIGSSDLDVDLTKVNDCVEKLENFFVQLEDTTTSLANDVSTMKHDLNEAFVYAHEAKDQLAKYERKKETGKDPTESIMITKRPMNPIVEKKLMSIENEIRKSTFHVRTCIQESRPILQHLEIVKSGKNNLNFQSILQSITKEKAMITRCSLMLDEINRDVMKMFNKRHIPRYPRTSHKDLLVLDKKPSAPSKPIDKFQGIKEQIKSKPRLSSEKLNKLKILHETQVLEPIRHSDLNVSSSKGLRSSDLLKIFKSPQKPQFAMQKSKEKTPEQIEPKEEDTKSATFTVTTPLVSKTKATVPTALFGKDSKPVAAPSPVLCDKPEINKNTATFIIDTSNTKANATKLSFDDSIAASSAFGSGFTKNLFTSTPAIPNSTKLPAFAAPTPVAVNFGSTFTKVSDPAQVTSKPSFAFTSPTSDSSASQVTNKPSFTFTVPTSAPSGADSKPVKSPVTGAQTSDLFSSTKPLFGTPSTTRTSAAPVSIFGSTTAPISFGTNTAPVSNFGTSKAPISFSTSTAPVSNFGTSPAAPFSISSPPNIPASTFGTSLFPTSSTTTTTASFSFVPSTSSKLSFSSTFTATTTSSTATSSAPFSLSSKPVFDTATTSAPFSAPISVPSSTQAFSKPSTTTTTSTSLNFGFASMAASKPGSAVKVTSSEAAPSQPKFEFGATTVSANIKPVEKKIEKSSNKKLEDLASEEHPLSADDITLRSLLTSSPSVSKNVGSADSSSGKSLPTAVSETKSEGKPKTVITSAPPTTSSFSFGSSTTSTAFTSAPKMTTPSFSFLSAAGESAFSSVSSTASSSSSSESVTSISSTQSVSSVFPTPSTTSSIFGTAFKTSSGNGDGVNATKQQQDVVNTKPATSSSTATESTEAVVPSTPPKPTDSSKPIDLTAPGAKTESVSTPAPTTPNSTNAPFAASPLVTPSTAGFTTLASQAPVFGTPEPAKTSQPDIGNMFGMSLSFGGSTPAAPASGGNVFGSTGGSIFGGNSSATTGGFGQSSGNIFAQKPSTPATGSVFGQSGGNLFGSQTPSGSVFAKSGSVFGDASKPAGTFGAAAAASPFGQSGGSSPFGNSSFGGGFGTPAKTEGTSVFGQSAFGNTATSSSSVFGASTTSSTSVFGAPTSSSSSVFGQASNASPFGFGQSSSSAFGSSNTASSGGFGAKSTFGQSGGSIFGGKSTFGQTGGSIFGSGGSTGGSVFGGGAAFGSSAGFGQSAAFGSQPTFGSSPFGGSSAFGSTPTFGGSPPAFGSTSPNKIFGSTEPASSQQSQSPGFGMAAAAGNALSFGNLAQQSPPSGFGFGQAAQTAAPAFGSQSSFGSQPAPGGASFSSWR